VNQEKQASNAVFAKNLNERGITKKRHRRGVVYQGVGLLPRPKETAGHFPQTRKGIDDGV
jgi:hypothetical protein